MLPGAGRWNEPLWSWGPASVGSLGLGDRPGMPADQTDRLARPGEPAWARQLVGGSLGARSAAAAATEYGLTHRTHNVVASDG